MTATIAAEYATVTPVERRILGMSTTEFRFVALALLVRLILVVVSHGIPFQEVRFRDYHSYENETTALAASIANGYGFSSPFMQALYGHPQVGPSTWVSPVYPYYCAAIFKIFGVFSRPSFLMIVIGQCLMSAFTVIFLIRIGEMTLGHRVAMVAAMLWSVVPWFSKWPVTFVWDPTATCLFFTWLFWYALTLDGAATTRRWIRFGVLSGVALLTNPALATLMAVSVAWLVWRKWHRLQRAAIAVVMCAMVISPWIVRNRIVFGEWVFLRSNFPFEFSMANFPGSIGLDYSGRHPTSNPAEFAEYQRVGELQYVRERAQTGKDFVRNHTRDFLLLTLRRIPMFWDGTQMRYNIPIARLWLPWTFLPFSVAFLLALPYACDRRVRGWALFLMATMVYPLPYYITFSQVRYRLAIEPLMLLVVCWAVFDVAGRFRGKSDSLEHPAATFSSRTL